MTIPPAHRRLVPRTPRKDPAEDLDVTLPRVVIDVEEDPGDAADFTDRQPQLDPSESLEITIRQHDDADDDVDAAETLAVMTAQVAELDEPFDPAVDITADPDRDHKQIDPNAFADLEPTSLKPSSSPGVEDRPIAQMSLAERGLLSTIAEGHEKSRLVYVDWLERRGEKARAEFLRLDHAFVAMSRNDPQYADAFRRLRDLASHISVDWRSRVARSAIEGCMASGGQCPRYWRALPPDGDDVRDCGICGEQVFYCVTMDLARARLQNGELVAVDITCERYANDLAPQCASCHSQVPAATRFCPHCGRAQ